MSEEENWAFYLVKNPLKTSINKIEQDKVRSRRDFRDISGRFPDFRCKNNAHVRRYRKRKGAENPDEITVQWNRYKKTFITFNIIVLLLFAYVYEWEIAVIYKIILFASKNS